MSAQDFEVFLRVNGLLPRRAVVADGKWQRCPTEDHPRKRNGAYKLALDGQIGWARNHALHAETLTWRPDRPSASAVPIDFRLIRERAAKEREKRERAIERARRFYAECSRLVGGHSYLEAKGLTMAGCRGLRVDRDGWLVVPMGRGGVLTSIQRIAPDGEKKFWPGAPTSGGRYVIERPGLGGASLTVLCEGLSTGLAIYSSVPGSRVVVTFNAGNLPRVAEDLAVRGLVVVAADNDHRTVCPLHKEEGLLLPFDPWEVRPRWCRCNPGRIYATEAAQLLGCGVAYPDGIEGTDWCDYRSEEYTKRRSRRIYGKRQESEGTSRACVDAEIERALIRAAAFRSAVPA